MSERVAVRLEDYLARVLRAGVTASVCLVVAGAAMVHLGGQTHGGPTPDIAGIMAGVAALDGEAVIRLGLLLLIATPVLRVAVAAAVFAARRDHLFLAISLLVLAVLVASSFIGAASA